MRLPGASLGYRRNDLAIEELWQYEPKRPVEWLAVFLMLRGFIPYAFIAEGSPVFAPVWARPRFSYDDPTSGKTPRELGKTCPECGRLYPATPAFWHRNGRGDHGLYSICKKCKCAAEQRRYTSHQADYAR